MYLTLTMKSHPIRLEGSGSAPSKFGSLPLIQPMLFMTTDDRNVAKLSPTSSSVRVPIPFAIPHTIGG